MIGIETPPERLKSTTVSMIHSTSINNQKAAELTVEEEFFWKSLEFEIVRSEYPGETPDFVVDLVGEESEFSAIYNEGSDIVFFSFVPEVKYGFLNSPPPGGWTKPLYKTKATNELLNLLKIRTAQKSSKHLYQN